MERMIVMETPLSQMAFWATGILETAKYLDSANGVIIDDGNCLTMDHLCISKKGAVWPNLSKIRR